MKLLKTKFALLVLCMALMLPTLVAGAAPAPASNSITAASDLRVGLGQLLGEHALLAVLAMQKIMTKQLITAIQPIFLAKTQISWLRLLHRYTVRMPE